MRGAESERVRISRTLREAAADQRATASEPGSVGGVCASRVSGARGHTAGRAPRQLRARGVRVGKQRVQQLMQRQGLRARGEKAIRVATTDSRHDFPVAPNRPDRQFLTEQSNQVWVGDITCIATEEGGLYLAVVLDLFSRRMVGWSLRAEICTEIVTGRVVSDCARTRPGTNVSQRSGKSVRQ